MKKEFNIKWTEFVLSCRNRAEMKEKKIPTLYGKGVGNLGKKG